MKREEFESSKIYKVLKVLYISSLVFFCVALILLGYFESDVEISGIFWSGVLIFVYWLLKRVVYWIIFS